MLRANVGSTMRGMLLACALAASALLLPNAAEAARFSGAYTGVASWRYLGRFCFMEKHGRHGHAGQFNGTITVPAGTSYSLLLYYTEPNPKRLGLWERVHGGRSEATGERGSLPCSVRSSMATSTFSLATEGSGSTGHYPAFPVVSCYSKSTGKRTGDCVSVRGANKCADTASECREPLQPEDRRVRLKVVHPIGEQLRSTYFFVAIAACKEKGPLTVFDYTIDMTNGVNYDNQFSADEVGILETDIAFFILQSLLLLYSFHVRNALIEERKYHHTVRMLVHSIVVEWMADVLRLIDLGEYAKDGVGLLRLRRAARTLSGVATMLLILQLILVAKGWTIVRRKISATGRTKIAVYMSVYAITFFATCLWFDVVTDPASVTYIYGTPPGLMLVLLRCFAAVWFTYAVYTTKRKYRSKRRFYTKFYAFFVLYLLGLPALVWVATAVDLYVRAKLLNGIELALLFVAQAVLAVMYNPALSLNKSFPFHANTGAMERPRIDMRRGRGSNNRGSALDALPGGRARRAGDDSFSQLNMEKAGQMTRKLKSAVALIDRYVADLVEYIGADGEPADEHGADLGGSRHAGIGNTEASAMHPTHARVVMAGRTNVRGSMNDGDDDGGDVEMSRRDGDNGAKRIPRERPKNSAASRMRSGAASSGRGKRMVET